MSEYWHIIVCIDGSVTIEGMGTILETFKDIGLMPLWDSEVSEFDEGCLFLECRYRSEYDEGITKAIDSMDGVSIAWDYMNEIYSEGE